MTHQRSFSRAGFAAKKKTTRREKFQSRMEEVIPWSKLQAVIGPHYPQGGRGPPPVGLERMLRVYFLQQWYGLADEAIGVEKRAGDRGLGTEDRLADRTQTRKDQSHC